MHPLPGSYELIDAGDDRRLERFGQAVVDRPAPTALAPRRDTAAWERATARFSPGRDADSRGWAFTAPLPDPWTVDLDGAIFELRATDTGQVGLFPEQAINWTWLRDRIVERLAAGPVRVLHLFAYTGGATLAAAAAGGSVVHVDASRPSVAWARRNAERSDLADRPIRWLVDDVAAFAAREARRRRRYQGLVLDPPTYGHGPRGETWHLAEDLDALLATCSALLDRDAFALLTAHTPGEHPERLSRRLLNLRPATTEGVEMGQLCLDARSGTRLHLGAWARLGGLR